MKIKLNWAIGGLAFLIVGFVAFQIYLHVDLKNFKDGINGSPKIETEAPTTPNVVSEEKPEDVPGFKWVRHGDHWDKVPLSEANSDDWTEDPIRGDGGIHPSAPKRVIPVAPLKPPSPPPTYNGPLTYHEELLEKHPVKALILQTKERGHWSADWILPLPPDDEEAQAFARAEYLQFYYESIGDTDNPIYRKAMKDSSVRRRVIMSYPYGGRAMDLMRITWPSLRDGSGYAVHSWPSEYLGIESYREKQEREARAGKPK